MYSLCLYKYVKRKEIFVKVLITFSRKNEGKIDCIEDLYSVYGLTGVAYPNFLFQYGKLSNADNLNLDVYSENFGKKKQMLSLGDIEGSSKIHTIAWRNICQPKNQGKRVWV